MSETDIFCLIGFIFMVVCISAVGGYTYAQLDYCKDFKAFRLGALEVGSRMVPSGNMSPELDAWVHEHK